MCRSKIPQAGGISVISRLTGDRALHVWVVDHGGGGNLFFQLVNARYERGAMILTSNRGFAEWGDVFGDPVVATALCWIGSFTTLSFVQIEGSSYRLRQHAHLMPEHVKAAINSPIPARLSRMTTAIAPSTSDLMD
jgi:hypothetical protein